MRPYDRIVRGIYDYPEKHPEFGNERRADTRVRYFRNLLQMQIVSV